MALLGGASSQLVVPKASAQQAATLTKWETYCMLAEWDQIQGIGNKLGAEGWELVTAEHVGFACFKRPKM